jgi:hypothetical protein
MLLTTTTYTHIRSHLSYVGALLGDPTRHEVLCDGCPGVKLPEDCGDGTFSIAFLSPPAYDSEFYSTDDKQSINLYSDRDEWVLGFLFETIELCWRKISVGGVFVIQSLLAAEINSYVSSICHGSFYLGTLAMRTGKYRNKPLWVWKKLQHAARITHTLSSSDLLNAWKRGVYESVKDRIKTGLGPSQATRAPMTVGSGGSNGAPTTQLNALLNSTAPLRYVNKDLSLVPSVKETTSPVDKVTEEAIKNEALRVLKTFNVLLPYIMEIKFVRNQRKNFLNVRVQNDFMRVLHYERDSVIKELVYLFIPVYTMQPGSWSEIVHISPFFPLLLIYVLVYGGMSTVRFL